MTAAARPIRGGCAFFWPRRASRCRSSRSTSAPGSTRSPAYHRDQSAAAGAGAGARRRHGASPNRSRSAAISRRCSPEPPLFGRGALEIARGRDVEPAARAASPASGLARLPQHPSGDEGDGGAAGAGLGRGQQAARSRTSSHSRPRARRTGRSSPATATRVADITGLVAVDFMKPAKLVGAGGARRIVRRWHADVSARPSASGLTMRLTIVGCGDASAPAAGSTPASGSKTAKGDAAGRLRRVLAGGAEGARPRSATASTASCCRICTAIISAALPFLLLDAQFLGRRERPLADRRAARHARAASMRLLEVFFPRSTGNKWRFPWQVDGDRGRRDRPTFSATR